MLDILFENRNRTLASLIKLGDSLGRSLRENLILFSVDSDNSKVSYLSESNKLISGNFEVKTQNPSLFDIKVIPTDTLKEETTFDNFISSKVKGFIHNLNDDDIDSATISFDEILNLWEGRLKIDSYKKKLSNKAKSVSETTSILNTSEYLKFKELKDNLIKFIKENKDQFESIEEIKNTVNISNLISNAFNLPKKDLQTIVTEGFSYSESKTGSLYEIICRQEMLKKELLESKRNFSSVWASSHKISELMGYIYDDESKVTKALAEAIVEVPYLALASKAQLRTILSNSIALNESISISNKEIQSYASRLFEFKKPVKEAILKLLNSKYGINVQSLKETPSFKSLVNTQIVIFESLSKLSPAKSVQKEVLSNVARMLKNKSGVEALDVNEDILSLFEEAGMENLIQEQMSSYLDFNKIADDIEGITSVLRMIQQKASGMGMIQPGMQDPATQIGNNQMPGAPGTSMGGQEMLGTQDQIPPGLANNMDAAGNPTAPDPVNMPDPQAEGDFEMPGIDDDDIGKPAMGADEVPFETEADAEAMGEMPEEPTQDPSLDDGMPSMENPEMGMEPEAEGEMVASKGELMGQMAELESLLADLSSQLGLKDGDPAGIPGEEEEGFGDKEEMMDGEEEGGMDYGDKPEFEDGDVEGSEEEDEEDDSLTKERPKGKKKFKLDGKDKKLPQERVGD